MAVGADVAILKKVISEPTLPCRLHNFNVVSTFCLFSFETQYSPFSIIIHVHNV